jgi:hypothetical protein
MWFNCNPSLIFLCLLFPFLAAHAKPGDERPMKERTLEATLYLTEIHTDADGNSSFSFSWIPSDILERCLGKSADYCAKLDNCQSYPDAQKCTPDLSSCEKIIRPQCVQFGFRLDSLKRRTTNDSPSQLLVVRPDSHAAKLRPIVASWDLSAPKGENTRVSSINARHSIRAKVRWDVWTNGQRLQFIRLLDNE